MFYNQELEIYLFTVY